MSYGSLFTVSNFASPAEIQPILDEMPKCATAEEFEQAQRDDQGPLRATAHALIDKMTRFKLETQKFYLKNMDRLDRARALLSDPERVKYLSLFEIADILLPATLKEHGAFPPPALYAVHTALYRDEIAFRPLSPSSDCHRRDHLFEVFPNSFSLVINRVATMVRNYWVASAQMTNSSPAQALSRTYFGSFVDKARQVVKENRRRREWTNGGLKPSNESTVVPEVEWSKSSWEILSYLQWWASYDLFEPGSRFGSYGSAILRALDLYHDVPLDQSTAWTFLQEAGVIPLWEVPSRYRVRLPGTGIVKGGGLARSMDPEIEKSIRPDVAAEYRIDVRDQKVFCIDGPSAVLIDDGVSLERTAQNDVFWIHVHAADPSSCIHPWSHLSKYMEVIPSNIYLPGHFQAMLSDPAGGGPQGEVQDLIKKYSLAPGSPALTFSAKVNLNGDILDYKVQPTRVHDVVYMDPADVVKLCNEPRPPPGPAQELSVGTPAENAPADSNRTITKTEALDQPDKESLLTLYRLAEALKAKRLAKGAWPYFFPGSSVEVLYEPIQSGDGSTASTPVPGLVPADPCIKIATEQDSNASIVGNLMVLAGQVAARWCSDRNIPVPYRRDSKSTENFEEALKFATEVVYPGINKGIEPTIDQRMRLSMLTGSVLTSTSPGPHFLMGVDMYAKATSPLRRYSDLLVHWQIHSALAHEHKVQRALDPDQDDLDEILAFPREELDNMVSLLHMREKMISSVSRGSKDWILMALARAWRFEGTAPSRFRFVVTSRLRAGVFGQIDLFKLRATMDVNSLNGLVLIRDIGAGDEFDVELEDVNVHAQEIRVRALEYHPKTAEQPAAAQITAAA
jgi:hypothetical protein